MGVREFKMTDLPQMIALGSQMHQESIFRELDYQPAKLITLAERTLVDDYVQGWVYTVEDEVIGICAAWCNSHFFGDDLIAGDFFVYVTKEHRGKSMAGIKLIKAYLTWAADLGATSIGLGVSANINSKAVGKLYRRLGFEDSYMIYRRMV